MSLRLGDPAPDFAAITTEGPLRFHEWRRVKAIGLSVDSLQLTDAHRVATPVNWKPGEDVIIAPAVSDDEARATFPRGWRAFRPYLRLTSQPGR